MIRTEAGRTHTHIYTIRYFSSEFQFFFIQNEKQQTNKQTNTHICVSNTYNFVHTLYQQKNILGNLQW